MGFTLVVRRHDKIIQRSMYKSIQIVLSRNILPKIRSPSLSKTCPNSFQKILQPSGSLSYSSLILLDFTETANIQILSKILEMVLFQLLFQRFFLVGVVKLAEIGMFGIEVFHNFGKGSQADAKFSNYAWIIWMLILELDQYVVFILFLITMPLLP